MAAINFKASVIVAACNTAQIIMNEPQEAGAGEAVRLANAVRLQTKQAWPLILKLHNAAAIAAAASVDGAILLTLEEVAPILGSLTALAKTAGAPVRAG